MFVCGFQIAKVVALPDGWHARIDAGRLQAGVDDGTIRRWPTHDRSQDEKSMLEMDVVFSALVIRVIPIHEDVRACLQFVKDARIAFEGEGSSAGAGDDLDG